VIYNLCFSLSKFVRIQNEIGGECSMYWLVEKCIQSFSQKIWKEGHRLNKYNVDVDCIRIAKDVS
jgi:hypothetical protein